MKNKKTVRKLKLNLNKERIAELTNESLNKLKGGMTANGLCESDAKCGGGGGGGTQTCGNNCTGSEQGMC